jgi:hypothetical protein
MAKQAKKKKAAKQASRATKSKRPAAKATVRKVAAPAKRGASVSAARETASFSSTVTLANHIYEVMTVPSGCTDYSQGDYIEVPVSEPPPPSITYNPGGSCDGITAVLVE